MEEAKNQVATQFEEIKTKQKCQDELISNLFAQLEELNEKITQISHPNKQNIFKSLKEKQLQILFNFLPEKSLMNFRLVDKKSNYQVIKYLPSRIQIMEKELVTCQEELEKEKQVDVELTQEQISELKDICNGISKNDFKEIKKCFSKPTQNIYQICSMIRRYLSNESTHPKDQVEEMKKIKTIFDEPETLVQKLVGFSQNEITNARLQICSESMVLDVQKVSKENAFSGALLKYLQMVHQFPYCIHQNKMSSLTKKVEKYPLMILESKKIVKK